MSLVFLDPDNPYPKIVETCRALLDPNTLGKDESNLSGFAMAAFSSQLAAVLLDTWREVAPVSGSTGRKRKSRSGL